MQQVELRKLGQWPALETAPPKEVLQSLGNDLGALYRKGLTSLAHGYGLGALGYFRRVVDDASDLLLDLFATKAEEEGEPDAAEAIRKAKTGRAEDRLRAAGDALPSSLRPGNVNPLSVLYQQYSRGIHDLSDEECLEIARELVFAFDYVFTGWKAQVEDAKKYRSKMQKWIQPPPQPPNGEGKRTSS